MQHLYIFKKDSINFSLKNHMIKALTIIFIIFLFNNESISQNLADQKAGTQIGYKDSPSSKITGYLVYLPLDYYDDPYKEFPVVVFLHGMGEKGSNLDNLKKTGVPMMIKKGSH